MPGVNKPDCPQQDAQTDQNRGNPAGQVVGDQGKGTYVLRNNIETMQARVETQILRPFAPDT